MLREAQERIKNMLVKCTKLGKLLSAFFPNVLCKSVISAALN